MVNIAVSLAPLYDAVMVAVVVLLTAVVVMVKGALVPRLGTVTFAGVTAAELSLEVLTTTPPDPATPTR